MNPSLQSVILGVITNGATTCISSLGGALLVGKELREQRRWQTRALQPILRRALEAKIESLDWQGPPPVEVVGLFLRSPEAESVVRHLYSYDYLARTPDAVASSECEALREEFLELFVLYVGQYESVSTEQLRKPVADLFEVITCGCDEALNAAIDAGILSALDAKSALRTRILMDEVHSIHRMLNLLMASKAPDIAAIHQFEEQYRQQVASRHAYITPPYVDAARRFPVDSLYVHPSFVPSKVPEASEQRPLELGDFLLSAFRAVVLGDPGGGKSTLALTLCHDLAQRYEARLFGGRLVTPIIVVLRDFGAEKKVRNCSILQYIETKANADYQVKPPEQAFEYLLLNGRVIVIFDGLDELLDTSYRREISADVESFCTRYPSVPVLVTSREVGYDQAPLDDRFSVFRLAPFNESKVQEYATKWFKTYSDLPSLQQQSKTQQFLAESRIVPDLRANPLMLGLMCNIYRGENYIPRNRPDVYEKCANMLFERWDKSRGIAAVLPFESDLGPAMKYLAHWIFSDEALQGGVTEDSLIAKVTEYLWPMRFEDEFEAERAARDFVAFCRGRAWVFTDVGTTKDGERLYKFTHRTFLEHFTADYLVRTHITPRKLMTVLQGRIAKREWVVVAELAVQIQSKRIEGAGEDLISQVLTSAERAQGNKRLNFLSFAASCLAFIALSPQLVRQTVQACLDYSLEWGKSHGSGGNTSPHLRFLSPTPAEELIGSLLSAMKENRRIIGETFRSFVTSRVLDGADVEACLSLEIGLDLPSYISWPRFAGEEGWTYWKAVSDEIYESCRDRIEGLSKTSFAVGWLLYFRGQLEADSFIELYGTRSIFLPAHLILQSRPILTIAQHLVLRVLFDREVFFDRAPGTGLESPAMEVETLALLGKTLPSMPTPWVSYADDAQLYLSTSIEANPAAARRQQALDGDSLFGFFLLYATVSVSEWGSGHVPSMNIRLEGLERSKNASLKLIAPYVRACYGKATPEEIQAAHVACAFKKDQQEYIDKWIRGDVVFVDPPRRRRVPRRAGVHGDPHGM